MGIFFYPWWVVSTFNKGNISIYMRGTIVGNIGNGTVDITILSFLPSVVDPKNTIY